MEETYMKCDCSHPDHIIWFNYYDDIDMIGVQMRLNLYDNFWERVVHAFKYVFRKDEIIDFTDLVCNRKQVIRVANFLDTFLNKNRTHDIIHITERDDIHDLGTMADDLLPDGELNGTFIVRMSYYED